MTLNEPDWVGRTELSKAWWDFHVAHPEVEVALCALADRLLERGYTHLGMKMLWETLRYNSMLGASPDEDVYRLNNNYTAYYARFLMGSYARFTGTFEKRALHVSV